MNRTVVYLLALVLVSTTAGAAIVPITSITVNPAASGTIVDPADLVSLTTSAGTSTNIAGPISAVVTSQTGFFWDDGGTALPNNGTSSSTLVGLNVADGTANAAVSVMFGTTLSNADTTVNDLFILELGPSDSVTIKPLDVNGNPIGDFSLSLTAANFGDTGVSLKTDSTFSVSADIWALMGVAFEVSDFVGTGTLSGSQVAGISFADCNLDPSVIGYSVPEPATMTVLALGALGALRRKRR